MNKFFNNLKKLIKSKKGNFVSLCLIYPLWLLIIMVMVAQANNHQKLQEVIDTNQVISRIIEKSETYADAVKSVNNYMNQLSNKDNYMLYSTSNNSTAYFLINEVVCFTSAGYGTNSTDRTSDIGMITSNQGKWWAEKNSVTYSITIYTNAHLTSAYTIEFMGNSFSLVDDHYTITSTVLLCH